MFTAVIHEEDGIFVAQCPETGTVSQGKTMQIALKNLREATDLYLEEFPQTRTTNSFITTFSVDNA
jgi:predicted RNase H-like HicB family nuclease